MAHEINLVPDVKNEMIRALKLRNYTFFACIVVVSASIAITAIFGTIAGGQSIAVEGKKEAIERLSTKLNSYGDLDDFLTIKNQLSSINTTTDNKQVLSRTFNILSALIPTGADTITISELSVDLTTGLPTLTFEAQANAGKEPFIDYNVLDSFKKSMEYMRYDYGRYVDKEGNEIPAYCMIEENPQSGATLKENIDGEDNYYAYWTISGEGCNPSQTLTESDYNVEEYFGQEAVRIWRTPQYKDWYSDTETNDEPYMSLDGEIKNVAHFDSACITYTGDNSSSPKWSSDNQCKLIASSDSISSAVSSADGNSTASEESIATGIYTFDDSNGRDTSNELVLRFSAIIWIDPEVYKFTNYHMMALAPSGYHNVTDSYVQVQSMFSARAKDCVADDTACQSANQSNNSKSKTSSTNGRSQNAN